LYVLAAGTSLNTHHKNAQIGLQPRAGNFMSAIPHLLWEPLCAWSYRKKLLNRDAFQNYSCWAWCSSHHHNT
jgi:hypothetical protein